MDIKTRIPTPFALLSPTRRSSGRLTGKNYAPRRAGDLNKETAFVLDYFGVPTPELLKDVRTQVCDIEMKDVPSVSKNISIKQAYGIMKEYNSTTLCITNDENSLTGLITMTDIAASDMDVYDNRIVSKAKTPYENLVKTLDAKVLCGNVDGLFEEGRVTIGANTPSLMVEYITKGDMVVLGNRFESQFFAIEVGAACIILCTNSEPNPTILELAKKKGCIILSSPYDSYTVARLINQSMPIQYFMTSQKLLSFEMEDFTDEVKEVMSKERHRHFPVTDHHGHYLGLISKRSFLALEKKQLILVDHNEKNQAVDGIESADILEIIDHHRLGGMESINPVLFRNQPLGCTATIIYQIARESGVEPDTGDRGSAVLRHPVRHPDVPVPDLHSGGQGSGGSPGKNCRRQRGGVRSGHVRGRQRPVLPFHRGDLLSGLQDLLHHARNSAWARSPPSARPVSSR